MNIYKITRSLIPAIAMAACLAAPAFAAAIPKSDSIITHDQITLGDVFDGVTADADHYLAPAPELGKTVTLGTYDLVRISDAFNLGWTPDGSTQHVVIRRASDEIDRFDVQAALEEKLQKEMNGQKFDMELTDNSVGFHVPATADRTVNVERLTYNAAKGEFRAVISAAVAPDAKKEVSGHYFLINKMPVLKFPMNVGEVIKTDDIDYIDMRSSDITSSMLTDAASLVGQSLRHGIPAMKPVTASDVRLPVIVKKGDLVTMVLKNSTLSLTAQGRALDNGATGDAIRVMNSTSKQVVDAIVTGTQTVSIKPPLSAL